MAPYACMHFRLPHIFPPQTLAPRLAVLLAASALLLLMPRPAAAHGFLAEPPARNLQRDWRNCPHCVNFGGTWPSSGEGRLRWPDTAQPVCGELELQRAGPPAARYEEGQVIELSLLITAQHGGRHAFRLCPNADASERCLQAHVLERADGQGPYSWTPTTGGPVPGGEYSRGSAGRQAGERYTWRYRLPRGVSCERCVLQWWWTSATSCRVPGAPRYVGSDPGMLPCTDPATHPEEFRNCADISIAGKEGDSARDARDAKAETAPRVGRRARRGGADDSGSDAAPQPAAAQAGAAAVEPSRQQQERDRDDGAAAAAPANLRAEPQQEQRAQQAQRAQRADASSRLTRRRGANRGRPAPQTVLEEAANHEEASAQQAQQAQQAAASPAGAAVQGAAGAERGHPSSAEHRMQVPAENAATPSALCKGRDSGLHPQPSSCSKFLVCAGGRGWELHCPRGFVWDAASQACAPGSCDTA